MQARRSTEAASGESGKLQIELDELQLELGATKEQLAGTEESLAAVTAEREAVTAQLGEAMEKGAGLEGELRSTQASAHCDTKPDLDCSLAMVHRQCDHLQYANNRDAFGRSCLVVAAAVVVAVLFVAVLL